MKITFKKNYNNKLDALHYLAILPFSPDHIVGADCSIFVATKHHHDATITQIIPLCLDDLQEWQTVFDVGLSVEKFKESILSYRPDTDPTDSFLELLIFKKKPEAVNEKIAIFCRHYEVFSGIKYKIKPAEIGMLRKTEIDEELAAKYFSSTEWWAKVKSVKSYCTNINEIKRLQHQKTVSSHPNFWDKDYFSKLPTEKVTEYFRHLRSLGLKSKKNQIGDIIAWEKE